MKPLKIKPASIHEYEWAATQMAGSEPWIKLKATQAQCLKACNNPEHLVYIAHRNQQPVGLIILHRHGLAGSPYIKSICVADAVRSLGIGKAMTEFAENFFRAESKHIFLCVSSFNKRAQLFYERMGYRQVGEFKDYILAGESELLMYKMLS